MSDSVGHRVQERIEKLGISRREAARRAGIPESTLRNIIEGATASPRTATLARLAAALGTTLPNLADEVPLTPNHPGDVRVVEGIGVLAQHELPRDVPVFGTVAASELGKGAFHLTSDIVDYVRRPHGLLGAKDVYALYVEGESMVPKFEPGDLVFVHPHRRPRPGDYVVIQEPDTDNGEPRGFLKRLIAFAGSKIRTQQFNPAARIEFLNRPGTIVHKVMSDAELYGV